MRTDAYFLGKQKVDSSINLSGCSTFLKPKTTSIWEKISHWFLSGITSSSEPRITQTRDPMGELRWHVYDPTTGHKASFSSESEVRVWLDQRYYS